MTGPGPLRAVLAAFRAGAASPAEVAERTGLDRDLVAAAVEHLVRTGHLRAEQLSTGCPDGGCGGCGHGTDGSCAVPALGSTPTGRGPVLLTLGRPRRD